MHRLLTFIVSSLLTAIPLGVSAQIVPDSTLPDDTTVTSDGETTNIEGGTTAGDNLFHSFEEFSVSTGETAAFDNALTIENIISRVTGGNVSSIDGLIRANGAANLFLINPNGIIFGENAALDIGGSFIGSTADSIGFADGREFSAVNPDAKPMLSISVPLGLQYGNNPGNITVNGVGNNLSIDPDILNVDRSDRPVGLEVKEGRTLALLGGNVFLDGGNLTAESGRIELGSVDGQGTVRLMPRSSGWEFNYGQVADFQEIGLSNAASVEVSGNSGGDVHLQGGTITITDGSAILADTLGDGSAGSLEIAATEATEIVGFAADSFFPTRLSTDVDLGATGDGGDLAIATDYLLVADGGQVSNSTFGLGDAGNLTVQATEIEVIGNPFDEAPATGLSSQADLGETGNGGDISIESNYLLVADGAQISSLTFGTGDAGDLTVTASEIELVGASGQFPSGLSVLTEADGNGGNLSIETDYLLVADGAQISSTTFGAGDAGNLTVTASQIDLIGGAAGFGASGLFATAEPESSGDGGSLTVETSSLSITDGAQIAATTFSVGDAGTLNIIAQDTNLSGTSPDGIAGGIFADAGEGSSGSSGDLTLETTSLSITDGAQISTTTFSGDAGSLNITAEQINISGTSPDGIAGGIIATFQSQDPQMTGAGGDLSIATGSLRVSDGAQIATGTAGSGVGGDLQIIASEFISLSGSSDSGSSGLFATAVSGDGSGGNINIATDLLTVDAGATISVSNFPSSESSPFSPGTGDAGNLSIAAEDIILREGSITADTFIGDRGNINLQTDLLILREGSEISTDAQETATGGNISIDASDGFIFAVPTENSDITANAVFGNGGNIDIIAEGIIGIRPSSSATPFSDITASSEFGVTGVVSVQTPLLNTVANSLQLTQNPSVPQLAQGCQANEIANADSSLINIGQGGLRTESTEALDSDDLIGDVRVPGQWSESKSASAPQKRKDPIVPAQGWVVDEQGKVFLVADVPSAMVKLACGRSGSKGEASSR